MIRPFGAQDNYCTMVNTMREQVVKVGDVVEGRYRIIKTLGEGGMGTVFLAEHTLIKRRVAIKVLHPELATDADVIERFMNEARAAGTLGHPNIVESTDMGFSGSHVPYIVFEYLEGTLLTDEIYRVGGLPVRRAVRIAQQIASALHAAHNAGIVHRDLKSDNVFLTDRDDALDHVKVLDFGISRFLEVDDVQTRKGMIMGTPEFMAPEQITSPDAVDKRADVYALGVILYEMLTARRPFSNDEDPRALMHRIVNTAPPPLQRPEVPHGMAEMIMNRMLAKDPAQRYQTMTDVEAALDTFVTQDRPRASSRRIAADTAGPGTDVARHSDHIPRPAKSLETPWPPAQASTLDTPMQQVALPPPPARRNVAMYGVAAAGILLGAAGLVFALKSGGSTTTVAAPAPAVTATLPSAATPAPREEVARPSKVSVALNANVPNARVTFRRRVAPAPTTMQITPSDIVELVEVSAPGYKTVRYWLTFDRPTSLNARLVKGTGMVEASEEATLAALGELAEPATPAVAMTVAPTETPAARAPVVAAVTTAKVVEPVAAPTPAVAVAPTPTPTAAPAVVPQPRKIGRGAEPTEVASAPEAAVVTPEPTTAAPAEPVTAEPTTAPAELTREPAKGALAGDLLPKTAPAVAKPGIDRAMVSSVIGAHRPEVLKCLAEGKKKNASMKGTLNLSLLVDATGKVRAQVQSTLGAPLVAACVIKAASSWKFPARAGAQPETVAYPFTIN